MGDILEHAHHTCQSDITPENKFSSYKEYQISVDVIIIKMEEAQISALVFVILVLIMLCCMFRYRGE